MAYDTDGRRYENMITNLSECINKVLKGCRNLPITTLDKATYSHCREYFLEGGCRTMKELIEGKVYCLKIMQAIIQNQEEACSHIVRVYDVHNTRFEVGE